MRLSEETCRALKPLLVDPQFQGAIAMYVDERRAAVFANVESSTDLRMFGKVQGELAELKLLSDLGKWVESNIRRIEDERVQKRMYVHG